MQIEQTYFSNVDSIANKFLSAMIYHTLYAWVDIQFVELILPFLLVKD